MTDAMTPMVPYTSPRQLWLDWAGLGWSGPKKRNVESVLQDSRKECIQQYMLARYRRKCMAESSAGL